MTVAAARYSLLVVIACGLTIRLWTIEERSFWFDEAFSYALACESTSSEMLARTADDVHPPLSYAALRLWSYLAGTSIVGLRTFSVFWAGMTMVAAYLFCRDTFSKIPLDWQERSQAARVMGSRSSPHLDRGRDEANARWIGVSAAALIGASGVHIKWSQEARMYTLGTALVLFSTWLLVRALRAGERGRWWWASYSVCATSLAYTHNFGMFSIVGQAVYCMAMLRSDKASAAACEVPGSEGSPLHWHKPNKLGGRGTDSARADLVQNDCSSKIIPEGESVVAGARAEPPPGPLPRPARRRTVLYAIVGFLAISIAYAPWIPSLLHQTGKAHAEYWTPELTVRTAINCVGGLIVPVNSREVDPTTAVIAIVAITSVIVLLMWSGQPAAWLLIAMITIPSVCALGVSVASVPVLVNRFFLFAYMFGLCAVPYLAATFLGPACRAALIAFLVANSFTQHAIYWNSLETAARPGIAGATAYVAERRMPGETVIVTHSTIYFSASYYLRSSPRPLLFVPKGRTPHYLGGSAIPPDQIIDEEGLRTLDVARVWVLGISAVGSGLAVASLSNDWSRIPDSAVLFPDVYYFLPDVSVTAYERREEAGPPEDPQK